MPQGKLEADMAIIDAFDQREFVAVDQVTLPVFQKNIIGMPLGRYPYRAADTMDDHTACAEDTERLVFREAKFAVGEVDFHHYLR